MSAHTDARMASKSADFNYKVALASGLKSLQSGRFRQAEEQFRYLMARFPGAEGGYRGLAKVMVEQEDKPAALRILLDGGAALAKAQQRNSAIAIYREAVTLAPSDLTAHRRLAAALALGGDNDGAAHEYARYIKHALDDGQNERAQLEATYALERMPHNHEIEELARYAGAAVASHADEPRHPMDDRDALMKSTFGAMAPDAGPHEHDASTATESTWETETPPPAMETETAAETTDETANAPIGEAWTPWEKTPSAPEPAAEQPMPDTWTVPTAAQAWRPVPAEPEPRHENGNGEAATQGDEATVEESAANYLARHDPRGGVAALEAARRYLAEGRMDAASDLLLQLIASDVADHEAQRLLIEVTKTLGKKDVARTKVKLLVEALKLDGRTELAAEVEQLTEAI